MACTLVYTADHFVFDVLIGWTYVIVVLLGFRYLRPHVRALTDRIATRFTNRRQPSGTAPLQ